jgi:hypothetical protein
VGRKATIPAARVVRDKPWPATTILGPAPRRIPPRLWISLVFGGSVGQAGWFAFALLTWIMAVIARSVADGNRERSDDLPHSWMIVIILGASAPVLLVAAWRSFKQVYLLRHGRETRGTLLGKREVELSEGSVWHYTFEYAVENGTKQVVTVVTEAREPHLEDDALEPMLYDPSGRREATTLDHLPGYPAIADGELVARSRRVWPVLVLPALAIAGLATALAVLA